MENLFSTGDFQKDMQTLKNTLLNTKISHIEHKPKNKETSNGKYINKYKTCILLWTKYHIYSNINWKAI